MNWLKQNSKRLTIAFIIIATIIIILYDVFIRIFGGYDSTISVVLYQSAKDYPIIPLAFGVLMGHFFFPAQG